MPAVNSSFQNYLIICLLLNSIFAVGSDKPVADLEKFKNEVLPVLEKHCIKCHGPQKVKGKIRLDKLNPNLLESTDAEYWKEVHDAVSVGDMPPEDENKLTVKERKALNGWIQNELSKAASLKAVSESSSSMRRLTNYEYNYTMQDLFRTKENFSNNLPPDSISSHGFKNNKSLLSFSPVQYVYYSQSVKDFLKTYDVDGVKPKTFWYYFAGKKRKDKNKAGNGVIKSAKQMNSPAVNKILKSNSRKLSGIEMPFDKLPDIGKMRVKLVLSKANDLDEIPTLRVQFGFQSTLNSYIRKDLKYINLYGKKGEQQEYEIEFELAEMPRNFYRDIQSYRNNSSEKLYFDYQGPPGKGAKTKTPQINIVSVEVSGPFYDQWPPLIAKEFYTVRNSYESFFKKLISRAYRRPAEKSEVQKFVSLHKSLCDKLDPESAMREAVGAIYSSPDFLYLIESKKTNEAVGKVSSYELASRLSYFLWSSAPDAELLNLAAKETLMNRKVFLAQAERMLADHKSSRFRKHFLEQWLNLESLQNISFDMEKFKGISRTYKSSLLKETQLFFAEVLQKNLPVETLIDSQFTFVNEELAGVYGIEGVKGPDFKKVVLSDKNRGGLLGQASVLALTSNGVHASPIKRGVWLLEKLLNSPPPPPPPAVEGIDPNDPEVAKLSVKEQLKAHRENEACMDCHRKIDPWGLALENFDAIGRWRTEYQNKKKVEPSAVLSNGDEVEGVKGLKDYILTHRKQQFLKALIHKLTAYSLGRTLTFRDHHYLEEIYSKCKNKTGLKDLIITIIQSEIFHQK